ncbi:MAG TPA: hypothetical protein VGM64_05690 [Lacunisphaera sp.]|jgi:hypothetical protein
MKSLLRPSNLLAALLVLAAIGFLSWINTNRARHVGYVSDLTQTLPLPVDATSATGYAGGIRELIVPEHNNDSYQWLAQTQQMLAHNEWRLRHVDYDNAPYGREVRTPSPYRWWLGFATWFEHKRSGGQPFALAVEQAALWSDPVLQIILLIVTVIFTAWCFGAATASLLCLGFAALFPFASSFLPAQVDDYGLSLVGAFWSVLPLLAGVNAHRIATNETARIARRWFIVAGIAGGLGLWLSVIREVPVLLGLGIGALIAAGAGRREPAFPPLPWRAWAVAGSVTTVFAFLAEYFPSHLAFKEWRLETVHPLYVLAWLGAGELLVCFQSVSRQGKTAWTRRRIAGAIVALLAFVTVPTAILLKADRTWLFADALASRLTALSGAPVASSTASWLARDHFSGAIAATLLPLSLLFPAIWLLFRRITTPSQRLALSVALGPVIVSFVFAWFQLRWWNFVDASLLALLVATSTSFAAHHTRWLWAGLAGLIVIPGIIQVVPAREAASTDSVTETEIVSLVERDLAHWLANRVGSDGAIVFAPPGLTTSLYFHGGLRGVATPYLENKDGLSAALHIAASTSADEAQVLIRNRKITHIIMPSWEPALDEYARLGSSQPEHTIVGLLHHWLPPRWLRAVPYHLPQIPGFENQSVAVFEVTDIQDNVTALGGLAEYFAEMGMGPQAAAVRRTLEQSFPNDLSSLVAQAEVSIALRDPAAFNRTLNALVPRLASDEAQGLAWDRRVSLAIVLAEGKQKDASREQVERCLTEMDEPLMRSLSPVALYRLQVLAKAFGLEINEPTLRRLAPALLPPEMRSAL